MPKSFGFEDEATWLTQDIWFKIVGGKRTQVKHTMNLDWLLGTVKLPAGSKMAFGNSFLKCVG